MTQTTLSGPTLNVEASTNLSAVTSATTGDTVDMRWYSDKTIFVTVSGNTGAVTVNIQGSHDGTSWFAVKSQTYSAENSADVFTYTSYYPYMRVTSSAQSNSTVTAVITGRT